MTPSEINAFLQLAKVSKKKLANEIGCGEDELTRTITGERINQSIREKLANKFGLPVEQFFGKDHELAAQARKEIAVEGGA